MCLGSLLPEADSCLDQHGLLGADWDAARGHRQVQVPNGAQRCPYGKRGDKGKWKHEWAIGQKSHRVYGGQGRQTSKGAVPLDLHKEICRVR